MVKLEQNNNIEPYVSKCPKCGAPGVFAVLIISGAKYTRRCRKCNYTESYVLPPLSKKVIYLDQFVISEMMKALVKGNSDGLGKFWRCLFAQLDKLCKLQLIVCPESTIQYLESVVSKYNSELKRMCRQISGDTRFTDIDTIKRFHVSRCANLWIHGKKIDQKTILGERMIQGEVDRWLDRIIILVNTKTPAKWIEGIRTERDALHETVVEVFKVWQKEKPDFEFFYRRELNSFGRSVIRANNAFLERLKTGGALSLYEMAAPPMAYLIFRELEIIFKKAGVSNEGVYPKINEFLLSSALHKIPFIQIQSLLYAAMAQKAASGQKTPPSPGFMNDGAIISTVLPYSDAMFIDNQCAGLMQERIVNEKINFNTRLFSLKKREEFLDYLDSIEKSATQAHADKVREVYGDNWAKSFLNMYKMQ